MQILSHIKKWICLCCAVFFLVACAQINNVINRDTSSTDHDTDKKTIKNANVVLLLPLKANFGRAGEMVRSGFLDAYKKLDDTYRIKVTVIDTDDFATPDAAYQAALNKHPTIIVGPLTKAGVTSLAQQPSLPVPTLALNQAEGDIVAPVNLYQFSLDPRTEAQSVAQYMLSQGLQKAIIIAPRGDWGQKIVAAFNSTWLAQGGKTIDTITYAPATDFGTAYQHTLATHAATELKHAGIFLVATSNDAGNIVPELRPQASGIQIFALPTVYNGVMSSETRLKISGVVFQSTSWLMYGDSLERQSFLRYYPEAEGDDTMLYGFGWDAFSLTDFYIKHGSFQNLSVHGKLGSFTLGGNNIIMRHSPWVELLGGDFVILNQRSNIALGFKS